MFPAVEKEGRNWVPFLAERLPGIYISGSEVEKEKRQQGAGARKTAHRST
jgi:hypothetical protein